MALRAVAHRARRHQAGGARAGIEQPCALDGQRRRGADAAGAAAAHAGSPRREKRDGARRALDALLAQLDGAFADADGAEDWKDGWRAGPVEAFAARERKAGTGSSRPIRTSATTRWQRWRRSWMAPPAAGKARQLAQEAHAAYAALDKHLTTLQAERNALWQGQAVADIERALASAVAAARVQLAQQQTAAQTASQRTRLDEACAQLSQRLAALRAQEERAAAALQDWLQQFQQVHAGHAPATLDALRARLAVSRTPCAPSALPCSRSRTPYGGRSVLAERRQQHAAHLGAAAHRPGNGRGALHAALDACYRNARRRTRKRRACAWRWRRMTPGATARRPCWRRSRRRPPSSSAGPLNDLIGSADGKKFRNYAQQFTLDVLLGYANAHLSHLARRYQLERIGNPANPSLGLMVRDQDMGGEMRSVHSLSGGESFLVSLALALGLASLSSNRVRVESLFIDEGFGSLDAETLRVAMDALDGLQAMGRKVGVISHVQEMTERIATRILVQPGSGGKSVVTVR
jgi:exonuclease SbcC